MKFASKIALTLALSASLGVVATSAHALDVQYDYPHQVQIEARTLQSTHSLHAGAPAPAAVVVMPRIDEVINFATASSKLDKAATAKIQHVVTLLKSPAFAGKHVVVTGYTDNAGKTAANQRLSYHRALSVVHALVAKGIPATTLSAEGSGDVNPIGSNTTADGRAANRRVTFAVICH